MAAHDVNLRHRRIVLHAASLENQVLNGGTFSIFVGAGVYNLAADNEYAFLLLVLVRGDEDDILVLEGNVGDFMSKECSGVEGDDLKRPVFLAAVDDASCGHGVFRESAGLFYELAYGGHVSVNLEISGAHDCTFHLYGVLEAVEGGVDADAVGIAELEGVAVEFSDGEHALDSALLAYDGNVFLVCIACKASGILQQCAERFTLFHLVPHGTFHLAGKLDETVVRADDDDIVRGEAYVAAEISVEDIVVDVDGGDAASGAEHLDVAHGADVVCAACHIECMEYGGKCAEGVGSGHLHFSHDVDGDGFGLAYTQAYVGACKMGGQYALDTGIGLGDGKSADIDRTEVLEIDVAIGGYRTFVRLGGRAPDVDTDGIARAKAVVGRCGDVHLRLESELLVVEDVASEDLLAYRLFKFFLEVIVVSEGIGEKEVCFAVDFFNLRLLVFHALLGRHVLGVGLLLSPCREVGVHLFLALLSVSGTHSGI